MREFLLQRVAVGTAGAWGVLLREGVPFAVTLERTYLRGEITSPQWYTKIPAGSYVCPRDMFNKGRPPYPTYEIPVPGHRELKFHRGNFLFDSEGCPLVGSGFDIDSDVNGRTMLRNSREAFRWFMELTAGDPAIALLVVDP